ncbi:MAG: DUF2330 domain-containing protein [Mycobacterium sp.]
MPRWPSLIGVCALVAVLAPATLLSSSNVATACACGGLLSSDPSLRVADEVALVSGDGSTETVVMRLNLSTTADDAALVVPTPSPATVTAASPDLFDELAELTAPRVETVRRWTIGWGGASASEGAMAGAPGGAPTVLRQVQLGPLEATTLSGGDLTGVQKWLQDNDYQLQPEISAGLEPYLREGWSVVAMRLSSTEPLNGPLAPVTITFPKSMPSDELIYPMRMSAQAKSPQTVVIYTLGAHRMQRTDPDSSGQFVDIDYAGSIADRPDDPTLVEASGSGSYLTKMSTTIVDPAAITSDFQFAAAPTDEPFQRVVHRYEYVDLTLLIPGGAVVLFTASVVAAMLLSRRARRRTTAP